MLSYSMYPPKEFTLIANLTTKDLNQTILFLFFESFKSLLLYVYCNP